MGCWNKTCALSNLPIYNGEDVYVFVLQESSDYDKGSFVHTSYLYHPLLLPFESTYNDYGGGENSFGVTFPLIMNGIRGSLIEKEVGENPYHDIEVKRDNFNEENFFETIRENRLEIKTYDGVKKVKFVMMRKDLVDKVLEEWVLEKFLGIENGEGVYKEYQFDDVIGSIDELVEDLKRKVESFEKDESFDMFLNLVAMRPETWCDREILAGEWLGNGLRNNYYQSNLVDLSMVICEKVLSKSFEDLKPIFAEYIKGLFVNEFMVKVRRVWVPPCGEGSQDSDLDLHQLLATSVIKCSQELEARFDD